MRHTVQVAFDHELASARQEEERGSIAAAWTHLERAHILSQSFVVPHVRVHVRMFGFAWRRRDVREIVGQVPRILLAGPASALGRAPLGNTGGANLGIMQPLPLPEDLRLLLAGPDCAPGLEAAR